MRAAEVAADDVGLALVPMEEAACFGAGLGLVPGPVLLGQAVLELGVDQLVRVQVGQGRGQEAQLDGAGVSRP